MFILLLALGCDPGPQSADDCHPSTGDNCSCAPQCLTEREITRAQRQGVCDMDCGIVDWTCGFEDGACVVEPGPTDDTGR